MKKQTVARVAIPLGSALIMLFFVQQYVAERKRSDGLRARTTQLLDVIDTSRNAAVALKEAEASDRVYQLTHLAADHDRYLEAIQSWNDEIGVLKLISSNERFAPQVQKFADMGTGIIRTPESATESAEPKGSAGALPPASRAADMKAFDDLEARNRVLEEQVLMYYTGQFQMAAGRFRRRFLIAGMLLFCLALLGTFGSRLFGLHSEKDRASSADDSAVRTS